MFITWRDGHESKGGSCGYFFGVGVVIELICCVGVLIMPNAYSRLHYLGPAAVLGPIMIATAIIIQTPLGQSAAKAVLIAILFVISGPILSHATARAEWTREQAGLDDPERRGDH